MRITKNQLRQIIKEELAGVLGEDDKPKEEDLGTATHTDPETGKVTDLGPGMKITAKPPKQKPSDKDEKKK